MRVIYLFFGLIVLVAGGCSAEGEATFGEYEGDDPMECSDEADNDRDGLFDCDDEGCAGAPNCLDQDSIIVSDGTEGSDSDSADVADTMVDSGVDRDSSSGGDSGADTVTTDTGTISDTGTVADTGTPVDTGTGTADEPDTGSEERDTQVDSTEDTGPKGPPVGTTDTVEPMPVISRNVPVFSNSEWPQSANDDSYQTFFLGDTGLPSWLAYDLSKVPAVQRGWVVVLWINDSYNYSAEMAPVIRAPARYTIDVHAGRGGSGPPDADDAGWVTLVNIDEEPNVFHSRQHLVNLTDGDTVYNWIRIYVKETTGGEQYRTWDMSINMDVHDAHLGVQDSWLFSGDSITNGGMTQIPWDDENFAEIIHNSLPDHFPAQENCGVGGWTVGDGAAHIPTWLNHFPGRYVTLAFGTNDTGAGTSIPDFYADYELLVNAVLDAGKVPIIPTIPWFRSREVEMVPPLNEAIADLKEAYPEIVDGPDFWTYFMENQHLIDDDDLHPSPEGYLVYRRLWAEKMLEEVYQLQTD